MLQKADLADSGDREAQEWLLVVWAEWQAENWRDWRSHEFDMRRYQRALRRAYRIATNGSWRQLAEDIWEKPQEYSTCTSGGWEAYVCPSGCGCHLIPFTPEVNA